MSAALFFLSVMAAFGAFYAIAVRQFFDAPFIFTLHGAALMGLPPLLYLAGFELGNPLYDSLNRDNANLLMAMVLIVWMAGVIGGYLIFTKVPLGRFILPDFTYERSASMTFIGLCVLSVFGLILLWKPLSANGFYVIETVSSIRHGGFFYGGLSFARQFIFFGSLLSGGFLLWLLAENRLGRNVANGMIPGTIALFFLNLLMAFLLGGKGFLVFPLGAVLIGYEICVRQRGYRRIILGLAMLVTLIAGLQFFRSNVVAGSDQPAAEHVYTGLYFVVYDTTLLYLESAGRLHTTQTGEDFKNSFVILVPRLLWPGKPSAELTAGNRFARQIEPQKDNPGGKPPYGFAQWYVNFGWIGAFIGGALTGWLLALTQDRYHNFKQNPFSFVIAWHIIFFMLGPWPGGIHNTTLLHYALYIFPLFIFKFLTHRGFYKSSASGA
jgi:hypothetical protein